MTNRSKIKTFFNSNRKDFEYIEEYKKNKIFFNDLLQNGRREDIEFVLEIKISNYISPLSREGFYTEALKELEGIEIYLEKIRTHSKLYKLHIEACIFQRGLCLGRLKRYKESNIEFEKLLEKHPTNDNYIDWYKTNKKKNLNRYFELGAMISFGTYLLILLMEFVNSELHFPSKIKGYILFIGATSIVLPHIIDKIIDSEKIEMNK
ncbi:hypothetical protein GCQ56_19090 [Marinifilum sp. N1E240]|uniref:hypothetical protein n=1 Tax=Marinifilum sp. N1E240 TaxID=2608082 RepID=UPI00128C62D6|nr:hypothetical protein [Marinifilum sp. N1E240]MPQ49110.1 hypothetical protein [Marinifilum sp. N1E240]